MTEFSYWYYGAMPRLIIRGGRGYLAQVYFGFSIPLLAKTLFDPWKRDVLAGEGLPLFLRFRVWTENQVSRIFGAIVRSITLLAGLFLVFVAIILAFLAFILWFTLPFLSLILIGLGIKLMIGGGS